MEQAQRRDEMYELMRKESNRLKTFQMNPPWPKDYVDIKKLAKAGFFYAFVGDNVQCAFCRGQVFRWDRDDDPMSEHAKHFTTCPFIMGGEVGNEPLGEDPFPGPKRPRPYDVCGLNTNLPPNVSQPQYQQHNEEHQHTHDDDVPHQQQSTNNFEQFNYNYNSHNVHNSIGDIQQETAYNSSDPQRQIIDPPLSQLQQNHHTPAYDDSLSSSDTQTANRNSLSSNSSMNSSTSLNGICKICYTNSIELVFLPCSHSVSCLSCAQRLHSCPFCRATITTRIRTFLV